MSFQLFPPPPKKQKPINLKRPVQPSSPEPAVELLERAKAPVDFHELVIKVNSSNPSSPISAPPEAHGGSSTVGKSQPKVTIPEKIKSASQSSTPQTRSRSSTLRSGDGRTTPSSSGIAGRSPDTSSPGQHPPVTGDTISPSSQADRQYTASPSFSDATTLVRNQSTATHKTKLSQISPKETPVMRSIFPRYNPDLRLSQQPYRPTQSSPTDIPKDKISRKPYSPTFYVPHANVLRSNSAEEPYYTPKIELGALWDAANGKARPEAKRTYALQMHCRKVSPDSSPIDGQTFVFGSSPIQPFYSLEQALADKATGETQPCEVLITRNNPTQPTAQPLPVVHLQIETPPPHAPPPPPETFYQRPDLIPQPTQITTITPKVAILAALEAAAQSPRASNIATFDPTAESPAAAQLAAEVIADCEARNACQLFHCAVSEPLMPPYETCKTGTYELRHPTLGAFPVVVQGDVKRSLAAAVEVSRSSNTNASNSGGGGGSTSGGGPSSSGSAARSTSPLAHIPTTITLLNPFAAPRAPTPSTSPLPPPPLPLSSSSSSSFNPSQNRQRALTPTRPPTPAPDEVLARLSLHTAALTVDAAAIAALGTDKSNPHAHSPHPHMIDVAVAAVMAVLVAEGRREGSPGGTLPQVVYGGGQWPTGGNGGGAGAGAGGVLMFEGPPTAAARREWPGRNGVADARDVLREKVRPWSWGWWFGEDAAKEERRRARMEEKKRKGKKGVVDIELGEMVRGPVAAAERRAESAANGKQEGQEEGSHWLVELVLILLTFAFKTVVFFVKLVFKILGKVIGGLNRCAAKS
ncbi:hypothetical protein B0J12DRAFT_154915 [Macrophomina phaseolina]|uniref:Uncharacterized protein n=1 Tax=Macrophomina phaseolina TaxID=35725 RepID=A0ABQ8G5E5_9PEZI|nr:hypothetical protein B0J12DRAFT_154915 [Macrophomina phaseolina]